jgi:hypothetical protein
MQIIRTERLDILALSASQLLQCLEQPESLERELGLPVSRQVVTEVVQRAIRMKLEKIAAAKPAQQDWYMYWLRSSAHSLLARG